MLWQKVRQSEVRRVMREEAHHVNQIKQSIYHPLKETFVPPELPPSEVKIIKVYPGLNDYEEVK